MKLRKVICPVRSGTTSRMPRASAMSQNASKRSTMRSSTPARPQGVSGSGSSESNILVSATLRQLAPERKQAWMGWKSAQFGKTRRRRIPASARTRRSSPTAEASHSRHIRVAAWLAQ